MKKKFFVIVFVVFCLTPLLSTGAESLGKKLAGRILLQVEENGEAWYINPANFKKYFLGRPIDAFNIMRNLSVGITNIDLSKIPIGTDFSFGPDEDGDELPDSLEKIIGTNSQKKDTDEDGFNDKEELENNYYPMGVGKLKIDLEFSQKQNGKILLQVENNGEAWYVNPKDSKRYYLGTPSDFFNIMTKLGLGATNVSINSIENINLKENNNTSSQDENVTTSEDDIIKGKAVSSIYNITELEKQIFDLVNDERVKNGLDKVKWNDEVADVAREHSLDLLDENKLITGHEAICDIPMIHHEGYEFGIYNSERLKNSGVYYFSRSGENIALMSGIKYKNVTSKDKDKINNVNNCETIRENLNSQFKSILDDFEINEDKINFIKNELEKRVEVFINMGSITITKDEWKTQEELAIDTTQGWMNSPPHKRNIVDGKFDESGIGIAYINGYVIATQGFITRIDCGYNDAECCVEEGYFPYCYQPLVCENNICKE